MTTISDFEELTIASLFALSPQNTAEISAHIDAEKFEEIAKKAKTLAQPVAWSGIQTDISNRLTEALQTKVLSGWAAAWQKCEQVREKAEKSRKSPDAPLSCILLEHSIESTLHPYVEVFLNSKLIQKIEFDVSLETRIDGVILHINTGKIVSIQAGRCEWRGTIAVHAVELLKRDLIQLELPGSIVLKHPIEIAAQKQMARK